MSALQKNIDLYYYEKIHHIFKTIFPLSVEHSTYN